MSFKWMGLSLVIALLAGAAVAFGVSSSTMLSLLTQAIIYAVFALGVGVLLRQNGMVSFGHALYFGCSGYIVGILMQLNLMPAEVAMLATLLITAVAAFVIGLIIVRVPGVAFSMLTLAIGQMIYLTASRSRGLTGGADGLNIQWPATLFGVPQAQLLQPVTIFLVCWCTLLAVIVLLFLLLRGRFGGITEATRDNEERARFIGIRTLWPRAAVYALSATVTAVAGLLSALNTGFVSPESLDWSVSGVALMMVVIGGYKTLWGPALGAVIYFFAKDILGDFADHWMAIFGIALIAVIVFSPTGIAGLLQHWLRPKAARSRAREVAAPGASRHG
ncbi:MAG: branched-chain amino acid ABC transporter permease [Janthinobacterium lividum]